MPVTDQADVTLAPETDGPLVIYDGRCRFCRTQAARLARVAGPTITTRAADPDLLTRFPGLTYERCMREIILVAPSGRIYGGAEAITRALYLGRPRLGALGLVYYVPPVGWLANRVYRFVARHRYLLGGKHTACEGDLCRPGGAPPPGSGRPLV